MKVMRAMSSAFLRLALPGLLTLAYGQAPPTLAFRAWASGHAHPIASMEDDVGNADLAPFGEILADARVAAFGEPFHDGHEPLAMRNRLIRYGVEHLGFSAIALETCLVSSKGLYDYVLGRTLQTDAALRDDFCYGFGDYPENFDLIRWLHNYNVGKSPERQVLLYGIDVSGQYF